MLHAKVLQLSCDVILARKIQHWHLSNHTCGNEEGTVLLVKIASVMEDPLQIRQDITLLVCECT